MPANFATLAWAPIHEDPMAPRPAAQGWSIIWSLRHKSGFVRPILAQYWIQYNKVQIDKKKQQSTWSKGAGRHPDRRIQGVSLRKEACDLVANSVACESACVSRVLPSRRSTAYRGVNNSQFRSKARSTERSTQRTSYRYLLCHPCIGWIAFTFFMIEQPNTVLPYKGWKRG